MTGQDLFAMALRQIGAIAPGEPLPADAAEDARLSFNNMIDAWNAEGDSIFTRNRVTYTLPNGTQTRTYGTGGNWNAARPSRIDEMSVLLNAGTSAEIELPIDYFNDEASWQAIWLKGNTSSWPSRCWDDGGFPLRTLSFWPIPNSGDVTIAVYPWVALTSFANFTTDYTFPPGYVDALMYNLAIRLAPEYERSVSPELAMLAAQAKGIIRAANIQDVRLYADPAVASRSNAAQQQPGVVSSAGFNSGYYPWW